MDLDLSDYYKILECRVIWRLDFLRTTPMIHLALQSSRVQKQHAGAILFPSR